MSSKFEAFEIDFENSKSNITTCFFKKHGIKNTSLFNKTLACDHDDEVLIDINDIVGM